jgi:amidase
VLEWHPSLHVEGTNLWTKAVCADGGKHCSSLCTLVGEPLIEGMVVGTEKDELSPEERVEVWRNREHASTFRHWQPSNAFRVQLELTKLDFQTRFLKQWKDSGIDALILPVQAWVGYKPKTWVQSKQWLGYTALWNFVNYAGLTVPVTKADPALDQPTDEWWSHVPRNESDAFNHRQCKSSPQPKRAARQMLNTNYR